MAFGRYANERLTVPTLAIYGEHDPVVKSAAFKRAEKHADSLKVVELPGRGHFIPEEAPDEVLGHLVPFLAPSA
jgi:haloacetate dehalogenase